MLYSVKIEKDAKYGEIISISDSGEFISPFDVLNKLIALKNAFKSKNNKTLKYLVHGKIMTLSGVKKWAKDEYKSLPKCKNCAAILLEDIYKNNLSTDLFCSQECADANYKELSNKFEEEEHEFNL